MFFHDERVLLSAQLPGSIIGFSLIALQTNSFSAWFTIPQSLLGWTCFYLHAISSILSSQIHGRDKMDFSVCFKLLGATKFHRAQRLNAFPPPVLLLRVSE